MITVTKPFLPEINEYKKLIDGIWKRVWLTNHGPLVNQLEKKLKERFSLNYLSYVTNGTIALQIAIKALDLKGEIITTPFSYVATTSSIVWEGCTPIFVDINKTDLNINPNLIENAITKNTTAILATHVFGNPCDINAIEKIASKYNLKVIYDAAHCFGSTYKGKSVYSYGDIATCSFHATKIFHTIEGGALTTNNLEINNKIKQLMNFGHTDTNSFGSIGINGKNSEIHAAMGIAILPYMDDLLKRRKEQWLFYRNNINRNNLDFIYVNENEFNYAYFPIILKDNSLLNKLIKELALNNIFPRRYFYPSLNLLNYVEKQGCNISERISEKILCLPLYHELSFVEQEQICTIINKTLQ